jgi:hypothetical protein
MRPAHAQEAGPVADAPVAAVTICSHPIPALTPIHIEILADLGSATSHSLDPFPIRLADPIIVDGVEVVAAGSDGQGEVVHAKKSGGSGTPGELVLAARWIEACGQRLKLRSMNFSAAGASAFGAVNTLNIVSAASPLPIGLIGFVVSGRNVTYPKGTLAWAKTAVLMSVPDRASEMAPSAAISATDHEQR